MTDPPPNESASWADPTEEEVRATNGAFVTALGGPRTLTPLQAVSISAIGHSMTGYGLDLASLPATTPEELAELLRDRAAPWRTRILHVMLIGALLLEDIPAEVQLHLEQYAEALGVHDDMLALTAALSKGSRAAAMADFQRSGYEGSWEQTGSLQTERVLDSAWEVVEDDSELASRWAGLEHCDPGTLGRAVFSFYEARGFVFPGRPGSAPPLLAQHDWIHILADFGSTVESEIEVFSFIATANEDPRAFSLQAMVLSLFETGNLTEGAGLFEASAGHFSAAGEAMALRMGDAMRRGFLCGTRGTGEDLLDTDWFAYADMPLEDVRRRFHVVPKRQDAWESGSVTPWENGGISTAQDASGRLAAQEAAKPYKAYGASPSGIV